MSDIIFLFHLKLPACSRPHPGYRAAYGDSRQVYVNRVEWGWLN